jgi:hypothetical protein
MPLPDARTNAHHRAVYLFTVNNGQSCCSFLDGARYFSNYSSQMGSSRAKVPIRVSCSPLSHSVSSVLGCQTGQVPVEARRVTARLGRRPALSFLLGIGVLGLRMRSTRRPIQAPVVPSAPRNYRLDGIDGGAVGVKVRL